MEEKKGILDYLEQVLVIFGVMMLVVTVTCYMVGEGAKEYSTMFAMGREGIPLPIVFEYLLSSVCITLLRFLFFSDVLLKKMSITKRTVGMLASVIALTGTFAFIFGWFPVDDPICWIAFLVCFFVCVIISFNVSFLRERTENRKLAEALERWKEKEKKCEEKIMEWEEKECEEKIMEWEEKE